jgi:hypothetical protein
VHLTEGESVVGEVVDFIANMKVFVISMSGFRGKNKEFVPKEVSLVGVDNDDNKVSQSYYILPPYPEDDLPEDVRQINQWIGRNSPNGARGWEGGDIDFLSWEKRVQQTCDIIQDAEVCAKGSEVVKILNSFLIGHGVVKDLDNLKCPNIGNLLCRYKDHHPVKHCGLFSHGSTNCALNKCFLYMKWLEQQRDEWRELARELKTAMDEYKRTNVCNFCEFW